MKNRFKLMSLLLALGMAVSFSACSDDDDDDNNGTGIIDDTGNVIVTENITENTTWTSDKVYELGGRIAVEAGATLTIEPGTIIKGQAGLESNATALLIARGAKIMAEGTPDAPIIFTSVADEITPEQVAAGNFKSPNLEPDINGLWGGVLILGNAPISASNESGDITEVQIEGIPTSDTNGLYGGDDEADNSGVLKYVSIRHGGTNIGSGNEINGLSLGGVGSGTIIENVEIVANQDDGIEWFGGTVNVKNAVIWNVGDDGMDADQSWTGTMDNFMVITVAGHSFELDGPEGSADYGQYTFKNGMVLANNDDRKSEDLINTDDNTSVAFDNIFFTGIEGNMINRVEHTVGVVDFNNVVLDVPEAELSNHIAGGVVPEGISAGTSPAVSIDTSVFDWTWAAQNGATNF